MDFNPNIPIFRQIVNLCHTRIVAGEWQPSQRIPSVREMAIELCVNPRTVLNAYELLEAEGVIATRRGLGFFLCEDARDRVLAAMRLDFFNTTLPAFVAQMKSLGISLQEIIDRMNN